MATTTTNFGWDIPQSTDLVKDGATAIAALGQDIDTALVDLKGGTTGQVLAKATNTDLDFTWVAQDDSNAIQNAIVDAKGDLIAATAADTPARLAVGANGTVLTADSAEATGLKWATPATGMTLISTTTLTGSSTTVSSIPSSYKQLSIVIKGVYQASTVGIGFTLNGDSGSNYNYGWFRQRNATIAAGYNNNFTSVSGAFESGAASTAGYLGHMELSIPRYTDTAYVNFYWQGGDYNSTNGNTNYVGSGSYDGTAAISSFTLVSGGSTFSGGTIYVYGVN